jgi:hypothetical protein
MTQHETPMMIPPPPLKVKPAGTAEQAEEGFRVQEE